MEKPCANCPFRKDSMKGWLPHRIESDIEADSFVCHKHNNPRRQCAGHMILMGKSNMFYRTMKGMFPESFVLSGEDLIFDSKEDCINHHKNNMNENE